MISATLATFAHGLALTLFFSRCAPALRASFGRRVLTLAAALMLLHLPVGVEGISPLTLLRGTLGDLSIVTLVLLAAFFIQNRRQGIVSLPQVRVFALAGLTFFFLGFGLLPLDPYALGYDSAILPCLTGGLACLFWYRGRRTLSLSLLTALLGWRLHWLDSTNLWVYLLDVPLVLAALGHALQPLVVSAQKRTSPKNL